MPAAPALSRTERRKYPRKDVIGTQLISVDVKPQDSSALLLDISEGGFALQNLKAATYGRTRDVSFRIPDQGKRIEVSAAVVWKEDDRVGFRITRVDESTRAALQPWIRSLPELRSDDVAEEGGTELISMEQKAPASSPLPRPSLELSDEDFYSVVARARVLTCATGAAFAWGDAGGMVCRASTGLAPAPGARVQLEHGLSGECISSAAVVRCEDTETDPRVDPEVCRQLNLRSVVIVPVLRDGKVIGLIETFSNKPRAFRDEDIADLSLLAAECSAPSHRETERQTSREMLPAAASASLPSGLPMLPEQASMQPLPSTLTSRYRRVLVWAAVGAVLLVGAYVVIRHGTFASAAGGNVSQQVQANLSPGTQSRDVARHAVTLPAGVTDTSLGKINAAARSAPRRQRPGDVVGPANMGSEGASSEAADVIVKQIGDGSTPQPVRSAAPTSSQTQSAGSAAEDIAAPVLTSDANPADSNELAALNVPSAVIPSGKFAKRESTIAITPARLLRKVSPRYPESARIGGREGTVALQMKIDANGRVTAVTILSGDPELAHAAVEAVRLWRYQPFTLNGKPIEGETNVTVKFALNDQR